MGMSATSVVHLGFVGVIVAYLGWSYPAGVPALALQFGFAMASEVMHGYWPASQRWVVLREAFFLAGLAGAWLIGTPLYPLVAFALCGSLLLLVRHRALRYLPALAAADLVWYGLSGTLLQPAPHSAAAAAMVLVPLALGALAADAWLAANSGARRTSAALGSGGQNSSGQNSGGPNSSGPSGRFAAGSADRRLRHWPSWLWLVRPVLLCAVIGLLGGLPASRRNLADLPVQPLRMPNPLVAAKAHSGSANSGLATVIRIGDTLRIDRDQRISARLEWTGPAPRLGRMVYLRAITLPEVIIEGPFLLWRSAEDGFLPTTAPIPPRTATGLLLRRPGGGDVVLRPDGALGVGLDRLRRDRDGNWYQAGLGLATTTYRVSLESLAESVSGMATAGEAELCGRLPNALNELPWSRVERSEWASMTPEDAARDIVQLIQERCHYELDSLPEPDGSPAGALLTFLLSDDPDDRRGHCQYFSTAAVVLLRRAGHPARTVVGFASEEFDTKGVTFRGLHAHAWLELIDSRGRWQRVDATPSAGYLQRLAGIDPARGEASPEVAADQAAAEAEAAATGGSVEPLPGVRLPRTWFYSIVSVGIGGMAVVAVVRWWRRRPNAETRRRQQLAQADATLFACARELGVKVRASTTLSEVANALSRRTGIDLSGHLREHLAARYGSGPAPRQWPVAELRQSRDSSTPAVNRH